LGFILTLRQAREESFSTATAALKGTQQREEQELCEQLRLKPHRLSEYRRQLLPELKPFAA
jgi:hypothetical protein